MNNQIEDIIKKRDDYRIKIFNLYYSVAKTCKQFVSQKAIRKIKQNNQKVYNLGDTMDEVSQKLKLTEDIKKNEKVVKAIKEIKSQELKSLALLFILEVKKYNIQKEIDFFNKQFGGDYQKVLEELKENLKNKDSDISIFKRKFESHARYIQFLEQCNRVMSVVENKLEKSKKIRQNKKEKLKLKLQHRQNDQSQPQVELTEEEKKQKEEEKKKKDEEKKFERLKMKEIKQTAIQSKYDKLAAKHKRDKPEERTEFKKKGKERKQQIKQEKIEKRFKRDEQEREQVTKKSDFKAQNIKNMDQLHPSWTARLQQQQQQANLLDFKGTVKML